jgi:hypothetical protein
MLTIGTMTLADSESKNALCVVAFACGRVNNVSGPSIEFAAAPRHERVFRTLHSDAFQKYKEAAELLQPLVFDTVREADPPG